MGTLPILTGLTAKSGCYILVDYAGLGSTAETPPLNPFYLLWLFAYIPLPHTASFSTPLNASATLWVSIPTSTLHATVTPLQYLPASFKRGSNVVSGPIIQHPHTPEWSIKDPSPRNIFNTESTELYCSLVVSLDTTDAMQSDQMGGEGGVLTCLGGSQKKM